MTWYSQFNSIQRSTQQSALRIIATTSGKLGREGSSYRQTAIRPNNRALLSTSTMTQGHQDTTSDFDDTPLWSSLYRSQPPNERIKASYAQSLELRENPLSPPFPFFSELLHFKPWILDETTSSSRPLSKASLGSWKTTGLLTFQMRRAMTGGPCSMTVYTRSIY